MLDASVHFAFDAGLMDVTPDLDRDLLNIVLALTLALLHLRGQIIIYVRIKIFERKIVEFDLDLGNTEAVGDRRIDIQCLLGDPLLFLGRHELKRAHIVQTVCQLDQNDTDVLCHGQKHLTQIPGLHVLLGL